MKYSQKEYITLSSENQTPVNYYYFFNMYESFKKLVLCNKSKFILNIIKTIVFI